MDVENIDANKFQKNSTSTRSHGKQWTYFALNIFELYICECDHLNNSYQRFHIESAFDFFNQCTTLDIFIYLQIL